MLLYIVIPVCYPPIKWTGVFVSFILFSLLSFLVSVLAYRYLFVVLICSFLVLFIRYRGPADGPPIREHSSRIGGLDRPEVGQHVSREGLGGGGRGRQVGEHFSREGSGGRGWRRPRVGAGLSRLRCSPTGWSE